LPHRAADLASLGVTGTMTVWSRDVRQQHGRKKAWVRHQATTWLRRLGVYSELETFDASRVLRLVFVCAGHTSAGAATRRPVPGRWGSRPAPSG